jgi:hypothetical protein
MASSTTGLSTRASCIARRRLEKFLTEYYVSWQSAPAIGRRSASLPFPRTDPVGALGAVWGLLRLYGEVTISRRPTSGHPPFIGRHHDFMRDRGSRPLAWSPRWYWYERSGGIESRSLQRLLSSGRVQ